MKEEKGYYFEFVDSFPLCIVNKNIGICYIKEDVIGEQIIVLYLQMEQFQDVQCQKRSYQKCN